MSVKQQKFKAKKTRARGISLIWCMLAFGLPQRRTSEMVSENNIHSPKQSYNV